jgi:uncharacterized protein (DUF2147 family)
MSTFLVIHVGIVHMEGGMSISKLACLLVLANLLGAPSAWAQQRLTGIWLTEDKSSHVAFQPCGGEDCGQIVWRRPLLGLAMLTSLKPSGDGQWNGDLYNPLDGMTYTGRLQNLGPDRLQLKGCALAGLLCQTETWTRVVP